MCVQTKPDILLTCMNRPTILINAVVSLIVRTGDQAGFHSRLLPPPSPFYNVRKLICFQLDDYLSKFVFAFCFFSPDRYGADIGFGSDIKMHKCLFPCESCRDRQALFNWPGRFAECEERVEVSPCLAKIVLVPVTFGLPRCASPVNGIHLQVPHG